MSYDQISDVALSLEYVKQYAQLSLIHISIAVIPLSAQPPFAFTTVSLPVMVMSPVSLNNPPEY